MNKSQVPESLLHSLLLDGSGGARELDWDDINSSTLGEGCLWLHFNLDLPGVGEWLRESSGLNDVAVEALLSPETRPRSSSMGHQLLLALRAVNLNPGADPEDMISIRLWTDGKRVISTRHRRLLSVDDVRESIASGDGPKDAGELLIALIDRIVRRMSDTVDNFEDEVMALEDRILSGGDGTLRQDLSVLRRQTIAIRRYLAPQREALNRLVTERLDWMTSFYQMQLREINDRQVRHVEDIDAVRERAALAQEELLSRVSEQTNERMYVLSLVAAFFLPLGFFTGLMGINVGGMPGVDSSEAFWMVVGLCVMLMMVLAMVFRWKKWL